MRTCAPDCHCCRGRPSPPAWIAAPCSGHGAWPATWLRQSARGAGRSRPTRTTAAGLEGVLLAFAYPDRIARKRAGADNRFVLANGRGAQFAQPQSLSQREFIVAIDVG